MQVVLLDPFYRVGLGHFGWHLRLAEALNRRGRQVRIYGHHTCKAEAREGLSQSPLFSLAGRDSGGDDPAMEAVRSFRRHTAALARDLSSLEQGGLAPDDVVVVMAAHENQLLGFARWMCRFQPEACPRLFIQLMRPSGIDVRRGRVQVTDKLRALLFRLGFDKALQAPGPVRLLATGPQLQASYSVLSRQQVGLFPIITGFAESTTVRIALRDKTLLLYLGGSRGEKGVKKLPQLSAELMRRLPDWRFVAALWGSEGPEKVATEAQLRDLASREPRLELHLGPQSPEAYGRLLGEAAAVLLAYHPPSYRERSSGVLWEAIYVGRPVLVPPGTWLDAEARRLGASFAPVRTGDAASCAADIEAAIRGGALDPVKAAAAARRFRATNGVEAAATALLEAGPS